MLQAAIIINAFGVIIGIYSIFVTLQIYTSYRLKSTLWFFSNAIGITVWNLGHFVFLILPQDTNPQIVNIMWYILIHSGLVFLMSLVIGFHRIRYDTTRIHMFLYIFITGFYSALFINKPDWITYTYSIQDGFTTKASNANFWLSFSLFVGIVVSIEILYPFFEAYRKGDHQKWLIVGMILAGFFASFSNLLLPLLQTLGLPHALRFILADIGFLIFFLILWKYPFLGMYDQTEVKQVTVASFGGEPLLILSQFPLDQIPNSILTSGIFTSINAVLEEITLQFVDYEKEVIREFQLGENNFFIIIKSQTTIIFWYTLGTGVCRSKFRSLGRNLDVQNHKLTLKEAEDFLNQVQLYFPDFKGYSQYYSLF